MNVARPRKWTDEQLRTAVRDSFSIRQTLQRLNLAGAGGNYEQVKKYFKSLHINTEHFRGQGWSRGLKGIGHFVYSLDEILTKNSTFQSFKLKKRLFLAGLKKKECEKCGWSECSLDGRIPLELDHINGNRHDNRIENLRILCPNCHSLQPTHRGRNMKKKTGQWRNRHTRDT